MWGSGWQRGHIFIIFLLHDLDLGHISPSGYCFQFTKDCHLSPRHAVRLMGLVFIKKKIVK